MTAKRGLAVREAGPEHRYRAIASTLASEIGRGRFPVDGFLPTESDLCERFGVSRFTVREALRRLAAQGLVQRRQGSGTVVVAARPSRPYVQEVRSLSELFQYALDTRFEIEGTGLVTVDEDTAREIEGAPGSRWLKVEGMRRATDQARPLCTTTVFIAERFAELAEELPTLRGPIYARIEERYGESIVETVQDIGAEACERATALRLGIKPGAPVLRVRRRYADEAGATVLCSINLHPADTFRHRMTIRRG